MICLELTTAIELRHITKRFGKVVANDDISLEIKRGEILSLLGENGSGKTTLMNMLSGIYFPDEGEILVGGVPTTIASPKDAFACGIGMIHQHFKLVDVFTAAENIVLGLEGERKLDLKAASAKINEICERYGFSIDPAKKIYDMSVSEKQTVEIIKVLYRGADILILDEPTAVLTPQETDRLFDVMRNMKADGKALVIITHKLHEVMDVSDRVAVLRKGQYIGDVATCDTSPQKLTEMMVGHTVTLNIDRPEVKDRNLRLEVRDLTVLTPDGLKALDRVSFEVFGGEMKYPPDGIPYASGYPFDDIDRMDRYQPEQIVGDLVRGMRRSCEIVREKRPDLGLCINIPGPVTMAGFARRLETVMMDLLENPDIVEKLVSFCTDALIVQSEYMTDGIADALYMASASDNPDMMGDDDYRRHSLPAVSRISERMRSLGIPSVFHPHGVFSTDDRRGLLLESASVADGFQFAEGNEPGPIAEACGDSCAVLGGINGFSSLLLGPEERIRRDVGRFIDAMEGRRYIMTCSCSVNRGLPIGNLKVVADELRRRTA